MSYSCLIIVISLKGTRTVDVGLFFKYQKVLMAKPLTGSTFILTAMTVASIF